MKKQVKSAIWFVFVDHDRKEGCIKGPMLPDQVGPWHQAVERELDNGRNVDWFTSKEEDSDDILAFLNGRFGYPATALLTCSPVQAERVATNVTGADQQ